MFPADLIDVSKVERWCPSCLANPLVPRLDEYLAICGSYYSSPVFHDAMAYRKRPDRDIPRPPGITADVVRQNSYLSTYFNLDPDQLPSASTSTSPVR